jgi:tetratricopeptide (TPR) repeat protein
MAGRVESAWSMLGNMRFAWMLCVTVGLQAAQGQAARQNSVLGSGARGPSASVEGAQNGATVSIESLRSAVAQAPSNAALRLKLAAAYYRVGDLLHARIEYEAVHAAVPRNLSAAVGLGSTYVKLGRYNEAVELLAPFERVHAGNLDLEYVLGYAEIESGQSAQGIPRMETVARSRHSADAYVIAGSAWIYLSKFRQARTDLEAANALNPALPGLQTLLGQACYALGDTAAAVPALQAALRQNPQDFTANLYLGTIRLKNRDFDNARPLLELALQLGPNVPLARLELARLDGMTGKEEQAVKALEALETDHPDWLDPHVELAALYYKLHRPADGERERQIVAKLQAQQQKAEGKAGK